MLTLKQEKFVQNIMLGMNQADAYRASYNAKNMCDNAIYREASLLLENPKVTQRKPKEDFTLVPVWDMFIKTSCYQIPQNLQALYIIANHDY